MSDKKTDAIFDKAVFGGYDTKQVDEFVEEARKLLSSQKKENEVLKQKLTILADKIEEYRAAETSGSAVSVAQPATFSAAQTETLAKYEDALASLETRIGEAQAELEALIREKTALASSLSAQYEKCLNAMRAETTVAIPVEPTVSNAEPDVVVEESTNPAPAAAEPVDVLATVEPVAEEEPVFEDSISISEPIAEPIPEASLQEAEKSVEPQQVSVIDIELPDSEAESATSAVDVPSIAETVEAGESVYLNADPKEMAKLSYEEALAMVLKKNGILRTVSTAEQPQNEEPENKAEEPTPSESPVVREDLQTTKIIPRVQMTSTAAPAPEKTEKKKKERSFFGGIRKSIHNFLEDESDDDVYPLGNNNLDKTSELKFGKAYNVKNDK